MSSELLAGRARLSAADTAPQASRPPWIGQAFDPYLTAPRPGDPGARHAAWTMAHTLRPAVRDLMARADGPLDAILLGAAEGWLALQLLGWGAGTVTIVDPEAARLEGALRLAEATAADPTGKALRAVPAISQARPARLDLALLDAREGMPGAGPEAISVAARRAATLIVLTDQRVGARRALLEAGLEGPRLLPVPADSERRFVRLELALIEARVANG